MQNARLNFTEMATFFCVAFSAWDILSLHCSVSNVRLLRLKSERKQWKEESWVWLTLVTASMFAPCRQRWRTTSRLPLLAARWSGVLPYWINTESFHRLVFSQYRVTCDNITTIYLYVWDIMNLDLEKSNTKHFRFWNLHSNIQ